MSRWTHTICRPCWDQSHSTGAAPSHTLVDPEAEPCCFCGTETAAGIYVRRDPEAPELVCHATGPAHQED